MLFRRSFFREMANAASAVFITLLTIVLTVALVRFLGQAANGVVANESVVALITFSALNNLPVLLQLTVFISVLMALTRAWRDGEMVVWMTSGVGLWRWIVPILWFALPIAVAVGILSLVVTPWANLQASEFKARFEQRSDVSRVSPGQFRESADGLRVFFVEGLTDDLTNVRNVFVSTTSHDRFGVMVSNSGRMEVQPNGDQFLVLEQGRRYEGTVGQRDYKIIEFARYAVRTETSAPDLNIDGPMRARSSWDLFSDATPASMGELVWRMGLPLSVISLALLALPLSFVNPRAGRSANLIVALLVYFTYSNMMTVLQNWTARSLLPFSVSWLALHVAVLLIALGLLRWRMQVRVPVRARLAGLLRGTRRASAGATP